MRRPSPNRSAFSNVPRADDIGNRVPASTGASGRLQAASPRPPRGRRRAARPGRRTPSPPAGRSARAPARARAWSRPSTVSVRPSRVTTSSASIAAEARQPRRPRCARRRPPRRPGRVAPPPPGRAAGCSPRPRRRAAPARRPARPPPRRACRPASATKCTMSPRRPGAAAVATASQRRGRGTPWIPGSPRCSPSQPGGSLLSPVGGGPGGAERELARLGELLVQRLAPPEQAHGLGGVAGADAVVLRVPARLDRAHLAVALDLPFELVDQLVDRRLHVG